MAESGPGQRAQDECAQSERGRIERAYRERFGRGAEVVVRAPGRAVFLGAHTDHQGGRVLAAAIDAATWCVAGPASGRQHEIFAVDLGEADRVDPEHVPGARVGGWRDYVHAVLHELAALGVELPPTHFAVGGDLPREGGLSSSAAFELALCLAAEARAGVDLGPTARAALGHRVETVGLDLRSGPMDQLVCATGARGCCVAVDCSRPTDPAAVTHLVVPAGLRIVLLDSGVRRRLVGSHFNDRRAEAEAALASLRQAHGPQLGWRDIDPSWVEDLASPWRERALHVLGEDRRAIAGAAALAAGDLATLAGLIEASQASSRELWQSSIPELDHLAATAQATAGCWGARFCGGGFGGWVAALVEADAVAAVVAATAGSAARVVVSEFAAGAARA
jgi:galactokinase